MSAQRLKIELKIRLFPSGEGAEITNGKIHVMSVMKLVTKVIDFQYNITINEYSVKMIKLAGIIFGVIHFNACVLFCVPSLMGFPGFQENESHPKKGPSWPYLRNLTEAKPSVQYSWSGRLNFLVKSFSQT